jgi:signal transduction histidine kinase
MLIRGQKKKEQEETVLNNESEIGGNQVLISIKDTGSGIDPEIVSKLFSKFTTKSLKGTGLGLFICKSIVEAHGGRIWAENNDGADRIVNGDGNASKGATFFSHYPLTKTNKSHLMLLAKNVNPKFTIQERKA